MQSDLEQPSAVPHHDGGDGSDGDFPPRTCVALVAGRVFKPSTVGAARAVLAITARWAETPTGTVKDLVCFVPEGA